MQPAVLITGASKRIGKAIALGMAQDGYTILLHYFQSAGAAETTAQEIRKLGVDCYLFQADLSNPTEQKTFIQQAFEQAPNCLHLINNASIFEAATFQETTETLLDQHFLINFKAPFFLTQYFASQCPAKGSIINLLDTRIQNNSTTHFAYSLSKKMLYEFTKMAAKELAPRIRVNGVCPGLILPPEDQNENYLMQKSQALPLQKIGNVAHVLAAVRFFRDNYFTTGDCLFLDGGEHLG